MNNGKKGHGSKGTNKAGGGLEARIAGWEALHPGFDNYSTNIKRERETGLHYRKPGSQRKGNHG